MFRMGSVVPLRSLQIGIWGIWRWSEELRLIVVFLALQSIFWKTHRSPAGRGYYSRGVLICCHMGSKIGLENWLGIVGWECQDGDFTSRTACGVKLRNMIWPGSGFYVVAIKSLYKECFSPTNPSCEWSCFRVKKGRVMSQSSTEDKKLGHLQSNTDGDWMTATLKRCQVLYLRRLPSPLKATNTKEIPWSGSVYSWKCSFLVNWTHLIWHHQIFSLLLWSCFFFHSFIFCTA